MPITHNVGWKGRSGGPGQSAAVAFAPKLGRRQQEVLDALTRLGKGTALQIGAAIGRHWFMAAPRISELKRRGLVVETDEHGVSAFGNRATIWRLATEDEVAAHLAAEEARSHD